LFARNPGANTSAFSPACRIGFDDVGIVFLERGVAVVEVGITAFRSGNGYAQPVLHRDRLSRCKTGWDDLVQVAGVITAKLRAMKDLRDEAHLLSTPAQAVIRHSKRRNSVMLYEPIMDDESHHLGFQDGR